MSPPREGTCTVSQNVPSVLTVSIHRDKWSSFGGTSFKALHALWLETSCLHQQSSTSCAAWIWWNDQRFLCPQAKWERGHDGTPYPSHWSQGGGSHGLCRDWCQIGLSPEDTQFSTRNAQLQPEETQLHRRSEQMHDLQTANMSWRTCVVIKQIQSNPICLSLTQSRCFDFSR